MHPGFRLIKPEDFRIEPEFMDLDAVLVEFEGFNRQLVVVLWELEAKLELG